MELQRAADSNNTKGFYNGLKEVWGPKKKGPVQLKSTDEMETFSDSKRVVARWSEHFQKLLNVPGDRDHEALDNIPQRIAQDRPLYMVFVDFNKAFDTVGRTGLWQLLRKYGCPEKVTTMIEALHSGMMANVSVEGEVSESFSVTNGVKQGYVLAPTLFSIFLSAMLDEAFRNVGDGIYIQSRQSADLFNVAHFRAKTKTTRILMRELLFADDSALVAHSAEEMQKIVDAFSEASKKFGLKINIKKTEVIQKRR